MSKTIKILIAVAVVVVAVIAVLVAVFAGNSKPSSNLNINTEDELTALVDQIYSGITIEMPMLQTMPVDITDADTAKYMTGLESVDGVEYLVVSEPMMSSQAYSLVLVKVKDGANIKEMAKKMNDNIDTRKWICVTAEKVYTATSGDVICLVMSNADTAKTVYDSFKTLAGSVQEEYERTTEE